MRDSTREGSGKKQTKTQHVDTQPQIQPQPQPHTQEETKPVDERDVVGTDVVGSGVVGTGEGMGAREGKGHFIDLEEGQRGEEGGSACQTARTILGVGGRSR